VQAPLIVVIAGFALRAPLAKSSGEHHEIWCRILLTAFEFLLEGSKQVSARNGRVTTGRSSWVDLAAFILFYLVFKATRVRAIM
jgi:hypothetical protein